MTRRQPRRVDHTPKQGAKAAHGVGQPPLSPGADPETPGAAQESGSQPPDKEAWDDHLGRLKGLADERGKLVRQLYITFLGACVYIAISVAQTTHEGLLKETPLELPVFGVPVSLVDFYRFAPLVLVVMHLNLLLQLKLLAETLRRLRADTEQVPDEATRQSWREGVFPYFLAHLTAARKHGLMLRGALRLVELVTTMGVPALALLLIQVRFLPYHSTGMAWWHRGLMLWFALSLWVFWRATRAGDVGPTSRLWDIGLGGLATVLLVGFSLVVATVPDEWLDRNVRLGSWRDRLVARDLHLEEATLVLEAPPAAIIAEYMGKGKTAEDAWREHASGVSLQKRDLRGAALDGARLPRADLEGAQLQDATLTDANLEGADLKLAALKGTNLTRARLRDAANLTEGQLTSALTLAEVHLEGQDLKGFWLKGTNLHQAQLQGTTLSQANLQGANLARAQLQRADLAGARLQGATLFEADLQGANLRNAELQGAHLAEAQLQRADLAEAHLEAAKLLEAHLQGADLRKAHLQGANLSGAQLQGANLSGAQLQGACLVGARIAGADFRSADLWVCDLREVVCEAPSKDNWGEVLAELRKWRPEVADQLVVSGRLAPPQFDDPPRFGELRAAYEPAQKPFAKWGKPATPRQWVEGLLSLAKRDSGKVIAGGIARWCVDASLPGYADLRRRLLEAGDKGEVALSGDDAKALREAVAQDKPQAPALGTPGNHTP